MRGTTCDLGLTAWTVDRSVRYGFVIIVIPGTAIWCGAPAVDVPEGT